MLRSQTQANFEGKNENLKALLPLLGTSFSVYEPFQPLLRMNVTPQKKREGKIFGFIFVF